MTKIEKTQVRELVIIARWIRDFLNAANPPQTIVPSYYTKELRRTLGNFKDIT